MLNYAVTEIPSGKLLMGLPNYGYDWTLPYMQGRAAQTVGLTAALELALQYRADIKYDETAQTPYFNYTDNGVRHIVWFDDPRSIEAKLGLVTEYNLAGVSWWTVNRCYVPGLLVQQRLYETVKL